MTTSDKPVRLSVRMSDRELYRALQYAAIDRDLSLNDIMITAVRELLERWEDEADGRAIKRARKASAGRPGIPWEDLKAELEKAEE